VLACPAHAPSHVVAFIAGSSEPTEAIDERLRSELPDYMLPADTHRLEELPTNSNGKIDKPALRAWLTARGEPPRDSG
jgi:acyl-coenzyme A synthetase/AMP-(fatty) acid ligase